MLLQLSAAKGPDECALAVAKALERLQLEAGEAGVKVELVEMQAGERKHTVKSVLLVLSGEHGEHQAKTLAQSWCGSMVWICQSPYRLKHKRKNWFFGGQLFATLPSFDAHEVDFQYCRASGAGGQHVNKTDSAVRAVHRQSGIAVRVESQRSQHANKKLALMLLAKKLAEVEVQNQAASAKAQHIHHQSIDRGNVVRTFKGPDFKSM